MKCDVIYALKRKIILIVRGWVTLRDFNRGGQLFKAVARKLLRFFPKFDGTFREKED